MNILFATFVLMGAHSFVIQLDNKQLAEQYVKPDMSIPEVVIGSTEEYQQLIIKYSECGRTVTGRKITAKDNSGKVLKDWKFDGTTSGFKDPMKLSLKEIASLKQKSNDELKLYYSSNEFPEGQHFANVVISK